MVCCLFWLEHYTFFRNEVVLNKKGVLLQWPIYKIFCVRYSFSDRCVQKVLDWVGLGILWPHIKLCIICCVEVDFVFNLLVPVLEALRSITILHFLANAWVSGLVCSEAIILVEAVVEVGGHEVADAAALDQSGVVGQGLAQLILVIASQQLEMWN